MRQLEELENISEAAKQNYEERIRSLLTAQSDLLSICTINLTQDTFESVRTDENLMPLVSESNAFEATMLAAVPTIVGDESRKLHAKLFCRENLLKEAEAGNMHVEHEHLMKVTEGHYEWVIAAVDMVKNPLTGEIGGVTYCKSVQKSRMERELLSNALKRDYIFSIIVFKDTDEFYIYNAESDTFGNRMEHFWEVALSNTDPKCSDETIAYMKEYYNKEKMCEYLEDNQEFTHAFDSMYTGSCSRHEARFCYLDDERTMLLVTLRDITDQHLQQQWRYESEHDDLTGLFNRKTVFREARQMMRDYPNEQFVMLHCDIRHFRLYNTFFGEEAGDELLCRIAEVLQELGRQYCCFTCGRMEADVFCAFFPLNSELFEKHVKHCFHELEYFTPDFPLDLAIGAYFVIDPSMSMEAMFSRATIAAKSSEKNLFDLISRYDGRMNQNLLDTHQITSEMSAAIDREEFVLYMQPKYSLRSEKMIGAEALVRWQHPQRGTISPGLFIPVFEGNGFIGKLDRYMLEHVCKILRRWQDEGRVMYPISVNISRVTIYSRATVPFLKSLVKKYGIDPQYLELELTETAYIDDPDDLKRMLRELQEFGFKILMDDFGSGYSSLNTLRELPVDMLKLDMRFLTDLQRDARGNAVLSSVVRMSKLLRLPIVAEGVETREQAEYLREIGCEYVQGYLFGRPMPVDDYEALLIANESEIIEKPKREEMSVVAADRIGAMDSLASLGILEYSDGKFAYINANKRFLREFGLVENLDPASLVFRKHLDDKNYEILLKAFANSSETKQESMFFITWNGDDGKQRNYQGYVSYNGNIGMNADLTVVLINITTLNVFGDAPKALEQSGFGDEFADIIRSTAYMFEQIFLVDLTSDTYSTVMKQEGSDKDFLISASFSEFASKAEGRFYNPLNKHLLDYCFNAKGLEEMLRDHNDYYVECKDRKREENVYGATIYCLERKDGVPSKVVYAIRDITDTKVREHDYQNELKQANERLRNLANRDTLTGLYNRRGLMEIVSNQLTEESRVAMLLIDVDQFKEVNDSYGHVVGDELLRYVSAKLRQAFRSKDVLVRLGGDEFMVMLMDCRYEQGKCIPDKIREINDMLANPAGDIPAASISVGVAFSRKGETQELYNRADAALYNVKENGRCGCCIYEDTFEDDMEEKDN